MDELTRKRRRKALVAIYVGAILELLGMAMESKGGLNSDGPIPALVGMILITAGAVYLPPVVSDKNMYKSGCLGAFAASIPVVFCMFIIPVGGNTKESAKAVVCMVNLKEACRALLLYASDNDDLLPKRNWLDIVEATMKRTVKCRIAEGTGYSFSLGLAGKSTKKPEAAAEHEMLLFDSYATERNSYRTMLSFATRHHGKGNVVFLDTHAQRLPGTEMD